MEEDKKTKDKIDYIVSMEIEDRDTALSLMYKLSTLVRRIFPEQNPSITVKYSGRQYQI